MKVTQSKDLTISLTVRELRTIIRALILTVQPASEEATTCRYLAYRITNARGEELSLVQSQNDNLKKMSCHDGESEPVA